MVYVTCMALQSIMFERSCLFSNIEALYIDKFTCTFLIIVVVEENVQRQCPSCMHTFLFTKMHARRDVINT